MADNMGANILIKSLLLSSPFGAPLLQASVSINLLKYDDPIDYLMFENSVRMRTEADIYIKTEGSV
tara:strand:- start:589 stop:786 length:198 start_codon:yes stop_codon:yes gene_type:complete